MKTCSNTVGDGSSANTHVSTNKTWGYEQRIAERRADYLATPALSGG
jgi:hypothetical protein